MKQVIRYLRPLSVLAVILLLLFIIPVDAKSVYYPAKGNGSGAFNVYTGVTCTNLGASSPCARYNESDLRIDFDMDSVRYQVKNNMGNWRWIQYDIPNPTGLIPTTSNNPKSVVWMGMYANNTNLRYVMQSHGIKLDIWGNGTPPSNYFNFTYTLSAGTSIRMQGEEIQFMDSVTGEPLWLVKYPTMHVNGTDVPLTFKKDGDKISIHAPDLFTNPEYNFSSDWELDPSTQSGSTIYIVDRNNLTAVSADINNASALQNLGSGEWLLNANLINNNTANIFYMNETDATWLKINSTHTDSGNATWYYLTNGKTEVDNMKITSWNVTTAAVEELPVISWSRSAVYASGASSKMNISNSNLSYMGYNAVNNYGVTYALSSYNTIINNSFLQNYYGIFLSSSSNNNNLTSNTGTSDTGHGIYLHTSSNNNLTSNTGTSNTNYGIYLYTSSNNNNLTSNTGTSNTNYGLYLSSSSNSNNLISNTGTSDTSRGIYLYISSNNNLTSNTGTSNTNYGIYLHTSSNNNLTSNTGTSDISHGIYLYTSSNNNLTSNTGTSNTNYGIYLSTSSNNNNLTSNIFNTNSSTLTVADIVIRGSLSNNIFINTSFSKPRKILLYDNTSQFNMSQGVNAFVSTQNIGTELTTLTTNRSINNWTQQNISFSETWTNAKQIQYNVSGLLSSTTYSIWNGTVNDRNLTTDASGQLPIFSINFSTTQTIIQFIIQSEESGESIEYIPPTPVSLNQTNNSAGFWINYTWVAGSGNVTNSYNVSVNGTWTNGSSQAWSNGTVAPHGWRNITVWAWNSSVGNISLANTSMNTQISNNALTQSAIGDKQAQEGAWLNFSIIVSDPDSDIIIYDSNKSKGTLTGNNFNWSTTEGDSGTYIWYFNSSDGYGSTGNETIAVTVFDSTPGEISNLANTSGNFWINWTWTAGNNADDHDVFINETDVGTDNTSTFFNGTYSAHAQRIISVRSHNHTINTYSAWVNQTSNISNNAPTLDAISAKSGNEGTWINFSVTGTDLDSDSLTCVSNNTKGTLSNCNFNWSTTPTDAGSYAWVFYLNDSYGGSVNETVMITVTNIPLSILTKTPSTDVIDNIGATRAFSITANRTYNATWRINNTVVSYANSYTNTSASLGYWNVSVEINETGVSTDTSYIMTNWTVNDLPTFIPPTPVWVSNITGSYWVNHSWTSGSGNITDSYNVSQNGTWYNGTTATFMNVTLSPSGWSNITIWAYNSSGTGTLSLLNLTNNSQAPDTPITFIPSTPTSCTSTNGTTWINVSCSTGSGNITDGMNFTNTNLSTWNNNSVFFWNNTGLTSGTYYNYRIFAFNNTGQLNLSYATVGNRTNSSSMSDNLNSFTFSNISQSETQIYMSSQANTIKADAVDSDGFIKTMIVGITYLGVEFNYSMSGGNNTWTYDFRSGVPGSYQVTHFYATDNASGTNYTTASLNFVVVQVITGGAPPPVPPSITPTPTPLASVTVLPQPPIIYSNTMAPSLLSPFPDAPINNLAQLAMTGTTYFDHASSEMRWAIIIILFWGLVFYASSRKRKRR